ncbi:MAG: tRNA glutamyl-Q(34) synthetase GluQRS [Rhodospirillales bacterium CG15_BIG_FIL_POST_REV_8_21_14_020_66_15]|nr:MAG: tRNA glutamyl-Q(34) synthetase GluQRS [Rhodospirillales bacterium CG15_BIG_FIL_POST_REV_8_21_14_020_66_15]
MPATSAATVTRFAPSPTGRLHLGHAYSAWFAWAQAARDGGRFLLRIEDIDRSRCRPEFEAGIFEDLAWLGLVWETPVRRQSDHMDDYARALDDLKAQSLIYPCFCTRKDIQREIAAAGHAPHDIPRGPDGPTYPGICRNLDPADAEVRMAGGEAFALRLKTDPAAARAGPLTWRDLERGEQTARPEMFGDVVLARKDAPTSYHLSVTLDDHVQGVTCVTRGEDLFAATHVHRLLQALLGLATPVYRHHGLLTGPDGKRFAKRDKAETIESLRASGRTPGEVWTMAGVPAEARP